MEGMRISAHESYQSLNDNLDSQNHSVLWCVTQQDVFCYLLFKAKENPS